MLIPDDNIKGSMLTPEAHVTKALTLDHPCQTPTHLLLDLQYGSLESAERIQLLRSKRIKRARRLEYLAERSDMLDKAILDRMSDLVNVAAANARLGLLTVLIFLLRWPDWQMTTLYTRGFKAAGIVDPSNLYPLARPKAETSLHQRLEE